MRKRQAEIEAAKRKAEPEWFKTFRERWISFLWQAMGATGNGYRRHSMRRTGRGMDRRLDKLPRLQREIALEQMQKHNAAQPAASRAARRADMRGMNAMPG